MLTELIQEDCAERSLDTVKHAVINTSPVSYGNAGFGAQVGQKAMSVPLAFQERMLIYGTQSRTVKDL